jgi:hypothetical protein
MKKLLLFGAAASLLAVLSGCDVRNFNSSNGWSDADLKAATNVIQTAAIPGSLKSLAVDNRFGAVHIIGTENGSTAWTWKLTVRARNDSAAQQFATNAGCKVQLDGDHLSLVVSLPDTKEPHSFQSDFEISVPKSIAVHAQNRFGRTDIASVAGDVEAANENGRLEIGNIGGGVRARTSFATLTVSNTGPATLNNQNGEIKATAIGGPLMAATSFASLIAQDVRGPATLSSQNGKIEANNIHGLLEAKTSFGSLAAKDISGAATLRNQNGRIEATGIGGALNAKTSFDSLNARDVDGAVHLRDQNGSINITQVKGNADVETSFDLNPASKHIGCAVFRQC